MQAVFDDEGSIHKTHGQIRIKMKHKPYVKDIQTLIQEFDINTSSVIREIDKRNGRKYYYFLISGAYNLENFSKEIGFFHPKKRKILIEHLRNIKSLNYGYNAQNIVLNVLRKRGSLTVKKISRELNRDRRVINHHLNNLKKKCLVESKKLKRKSTYEYLWTAI